MELRLTVKPAHTSLSAAQTPSYKSIENFFLNNDDDYDKCAKYLAKVAGIKYSPNDIAFIGDSGDTEDCIAYSSGKYVYVFGPSNNMFKHLASSSPFSFAKIKKDSSWETLDEAPASLTKKFPAKNVAEALALFKEQFNKG